MTSIRDLIFDAFRKGNRNVFNDVPERITILNGICDEWEIPRDDIHKLKDPEAFFKHVREKITGSLNQTQVDTINGLFAAAGHWPIGFMAYAFATAWGECKLEPVLEIGGPKYLSKYDTGKLAARLGNTPEADGDGIKYAGRGLVQLTGRTNYANAGKFLGIDLLANPDRALEPEIATKILVWGMETGAFTGKRLGNYMIDRGTHDAFVRCRFIINGQDKAQKFASYADLFQEALDKGGYA